MNRLEGGRTAYLEVQGNHEKNYEAHLSLMPNQAIEQKEQNYDVDQANQWVAAHEVRYHAALNSLLSRIEHISGDTFKRQLGTSIKDLFNKVVVDSQSQTSKEKQYENFLDNVIVLVEGRKSNQWIAELARKHFGFKASSYYRLGEKDARSFTSHVRDFADERERASLKGKTIVLFDDGSYSGKQMCDHVAALCKLKADGVLAFRNVCVIVPYMTNYAKQKLTALATNVNDAARTREVFIASSVTIPTVAESVPDAEQQRLLTELWWRKESAEEGPHSKGVFWFDHKIPNSQSFIGAIEKGNVLNESRICKRLFRIIPDVIIPYKTDHL